MGFVSSRDVQERCSHLQKRGRANLLDGLANLRTWPKARVRGPLRLFPMHRTIKNDVDPQGTRRDTFKREVSDRLGFAASFRLF